MKNYWGSLHFWADLWWGFVKFSLAFIVVWALGSTFCADKKKEKTPASVEVLSSDKK